MKTYEKGLPRSILAVATVTAAIVSSMSVTADDYVLHSFTRQALAVSTERRVERGKPAPIDANTGRVNGALEGEDLKVLRATAGRTSKQDMSGFPKDKWSGDRQLFWSGAIPGARLDLELPVANAGSFGLNVVLTKARDYATVQLLLDDQPLGDPIDLYNYPDVITTGVLALGEHRLTTGNHRLTLKITGANRAAKKTYRVGIDHVLLVPR